MMPQQIILMTCLVLSSFMFAQQPVTTPTKKAPQKTTRSAAPQKPQGLTVENVISLVKAGLSEEVIIARLRKADTPFDLSPEDMIKLKNAGASDHILTV